MEVPQNPIVHKLQATDLPISQVTVYTERAEVKRSIPLKLETGLNRILIENVARQIVEDSVRVDGEGKATIHEVQFKKEYLHPDKVTSGKIEELRAQIKDLNAEKEVLEDGNGILEKQIQAIGGILDNFGKSALVDQQHLRAVHFDNDAEQSLEMLYAFQERKTKQLKERLRAQSKELDNLKEKKQTLKRELGKLVEKGHINNSISVDLENGGKSGETVNIVLSYQVERAFWSPSYDVRVEMDNQQQLKKSVKITYFGMISQRSGEDWQNVKLVLSTAKPHGGLLPTLGTTYAEFYRPPPPKPVYKAHKMKELEIAEMREAVDSDEDDDSDEDEGYELLKESARTACCAALKVQTTKASEQILSTTFTIPAAKSIPADDSEHKVTIDMLDFNCLVHFDCVPSKDTNVYMSATCINSSIYPLLKGPISIYLNNCFNQKVNKFGNVSPGEKFDMPLGVFPHLKVTYKPTNKFHHQTGMLEKIFKLVNEQKILVKNNRPAGQSVLLTILEPIPKPTDEKIKIRPPSLEIAGQVIHVANDTTSNKTGGLSSSRSSSTITANTTNGNAGGNDELAGNKVEQLKAPSVGAKLNKDNNLEWTFLVDGAVEKELTIKWEAEYPANEKLAFKEKRGKSEKDNEDDY